MKKGKIRPPKVEFEFTDLDLTAFGGASILARTTRRFGLFELLDGAVSVKVRDRGASEAERLWSIIASLARGHGALSDRDALRADTVARTLLGLRDVPEAPSRGMAGPRRDGRREGTLGRRGAVRRARRAGDCRARVGDQGILAHLARPVP